MVSFLDMAKGVSDFGILVIIAVCSIFGVRFFAKFFVNSMRKTMESLQESQLKIVELLNSLNDQNQSLQALLHNMSEMTAGKLLQEQTKFNSFNIIKQSFRDNLLDLLAGANDIIDKNNIKDKETTAKKIYNVVEVSRKKRIKYLNNFKYEGVKLGTYMDDPEWFAQKINIVTSYIYSEDKNPMRLIRDLESAYAMFDFESKL